MRTERTIAYRVAIPAENTTTMPMGIPIIDPRRQVCDSRQHAGLGFWGEMSHIWGKDSNRRRAVNKFNCHLSLQQDLEGEWTGRG